MDLITKQILANHRIRITESLRRAGLGESYYWLRLGDKAEMFSSVEEMVNRLNETVPAPWTIHRKGSKYTILVSDKFKDGTPFQAFKTEDTNTEVTQALDDAELRLLVSYRGEAKDEEPNPYCPGCGRVVSGEYVPDHVDDAHRSTNPGRLCPGSGKKAVMARWTKDEMGCAAVGGGAAVGTAHLPGDKDKDDEESDAVQPVPPAEPVYGNKPMLPKYLKKGKKEPKGDFRTQLIQGLKQQRESTHHEAPEVEDRINYGHGGYAGLVKEVGGYDVEQDAWIVIANDDKEHLIQPDHMEDGHMTWWTLSSKRVTAKAKPPISDEPDMAEGEDSDYYHPDDDTEPEEPTEPDEDDITTTDDNKWYQYGKLYHTGDRKSLAAKMDHDQFWPNVWSISDHGNTVLISADVADARKDSEEVIQSFNYEKKEASIKVGRAKFLPPDSLTGDFGPLQTMYSSEGYYEVRVEPRGELEIEILEKMFARWEMTGPLGEVLIGIQKEGSVYRFDIDASKVRDEIDAARIVKKQIEDMVAEFGKKEAFGVTGTSNQGGMVQPLPKVGKGEPCWVCGTPIISTTSCHLCGADRE